VTRVPDFSAGAWKAWNQILPKRIIIAYDENLPFLTLGDALQPLGVGGTGETFLSKRKDNGAVEAVKVIKRPIPGSLKNLITNEIILQSTLAEGHINLVEAHEVFLTDSHLCLFMEFISGGTLTDYVSARVDSVETRGGLFLNEDEARYLFQVRCNCS
jgi:serine/threonine protein kinase